MANEDKKDFNAMLHKDTDMPKIQIVTDEKDDSEIRGQQDVLCPAPVLR